MISKMRLGVVGRKPLWIFAATFLIACCFSLCACNAADSGGSVPCTEYTDENGDGICDVCGEPTDADSDRLAQPRIVNDGNLITWEKVKNADYYDVFVNGTFESTVSTPTFTIEKTEKGTYAVTVCAVSIGNRYATSEESEAVNYVVEKTSLEAPQISVTDDVLSWMAIEGATGYDVYADGEKIASVTETSYVLAADYLKKTITVKATSTNTGYTSESAASNGVTYKVLDKTVYLTVEEQIAYDGVAPQTIAPEAWRLSSENVKAGQVLKVAFYLTTEQATLTDGRANSLQFTPTLLRAGGTQENGGNFSYVNYLSMNDPENRKVLVTYVMQLAGDFAAGDAVQIGLTANAGMAFTVDKMTIAGADYDFGQDTEYVLFHERATYVEAGKLTLSDGEYTKSSFDSYKSILFLNTTENLVITGPSSQVEGYNIVSKYNGQTENFESGQILKIAVYANITNLTKNSDEVAIDFSHTFWKASTNVHYGYAARSVKFSELEEGKFIFIIVAQIPEEYDANDLYMTWRVYNVAEGVTLTVDKVVVSGGDYDFGKINGDYEIALEAESTHAPTTPVDSWTPSTKEQV